MPSVFRSKVCLPPLFYECLREFSQEDRATAETIEQAYCEVFSREPTDEELLAVIERLTAEAVKATENPPRSHPKKKQSYCTAFSDYLSSMNAENLCFFLADFDPLKARSLYCEADLRVLEESAVRKIQYLMEVSGVWYEAVLFGMGGHYKGAGPNDSIVDLSEDASAGRAALQQLGLL